MLNDSHRLCAVFLLLFNTKIYFSLRKLKIKRMKKRKRKRDEKSKKKKRLFYTLISNVWWKWIETIWIRAPATLRSHFRRDEELKFCLFLFEKNRKEEQKENMKKNKQKEQKWPKEIKMTKKSVLKIINEFLWGESIQT